MCGVCVNAHKVAPGDVLTWLWTGCNQGGGGNKCAVMLELSPQQATFVQIKLLSSA